MPLDFVADWHPVPVELTGRHGATVPCPRSKAAIISNGREILLIGGRRNRSIAKDAWAFSLKHCRWRPLALSGLPLLESPAVCCVGKRVYLFGGQFSRKSGPQSVLVLDKDLKNFRTVECKIPPPPATIGPQPSLSRIGLPNTVAYSAKSIPECTFASSGVAYDGDCWIFGGYSDLKGACDALWRFSPISSEWTSIQRTSPLRSALPTPRYYHSAISHNGHMWVYGGMGNGGLVNDVLWRYSFALDSWEQVSTRSGPGPLYAHSSCVNNNCMVIYGGIGRFEEASNDIWCFSFDRNSWSKIAQFAKQTGIEPGPLAFHGLVNLGSAFVARPTQENGFRQDESLKHGGFNWTEVEAAPKESIEMKNMAVTPILLRNPSLDMELESRKDSHGDDRSRHDSAIAGVFHSSEEKLLSSGSPFPRDQRRRSRCISTASGPHFDGAFHTVGQNLAFEGDPEFSLPGVVKAKQTPELNSPDLPTATTVDHPQLTEIIMLKTFSNGTRKDACLGFESTCDTRLIDSSQNPAYGGFAEGSLPLTGLVDGSVEFSFVVLGGRRAAAVSSVGSEDRMLIWLCNVKRK